MEREMIFSVEQQRGLNRFLANSFLWMFYGLCVSAVSAYFILQFPGLLVNVVSGPGMFIVFGLQLFLAYSLRPDPRRLENAASYVGKFTLYSAITGITFAIVSLVYTQTSIIQAFITTAALFAILSIYGYTTKRDLTKLRNMLLPALIGVIVLSVINIFFFSSTLSLMLTIATLVIFIGLTMYDVQMLKSLYLYYEHEAHYHKSLSIFGALQLYLDFINIFLSILRLFGSRRD